MEVVERPLRTGHSMDGSQRYRQARLTVISRRRRAPEATPNTARTARRLQIAHRNVGPTLQGESQQHFGVVQVVQHRVVTRHVLRRSRDEIQRASTSLRFLHHTGQRNHHDDCGQNQQR